jgi:O-antigen/teichoic acid export membrane protein
MASLLASFKYFSEGRLVTHLRTPLFRNGYALLLSSGLSSGLGFFFWAIAARLYTTEQFGLNSAMVSAIMFLSGISQLSLQGMLIRYLPVVGRSTRRLIGYTYLVVIVGGTLAGLIGLRVWAPAFGGATFTPWVMVWFVASVSVLSIFAMQDAVLAGLRQPMWVPLENATYSVIKIALLIALATALPQQGIFVSWTICLLLLIPPINYLIFSRLVPRHVQATQHLAEPVSIRQVIRYIAGNYTASILNIAASALLPVIIVQVAGAEANAHFYPNWTILTSLQLVAFNMTTSLTVEASLEKENLLNYSRRILLQVMRLLVPAVLVIVVAAPFILQIYGKAYSEEGTNLLRLLALSTIPNVVTVIYMGMARVRHWIKGLVLVNAATAFLGLGTSYLLLQVYGITGVGIGWLISQTAVAAGVILMQFIPLMRKHKASTA